MSSEPPPEIIIATPVPGRGMRPVHRLKGWVAGHKGKLIMLQDTPHSIALGSAIGIFFGFTPLVSLKTLLSIATAWVFRCNKLAAAIGVTLHDVLLLFMPAIYWWEYKTGYRLLHGISPPRIRFSHIAMQDYLHWKMFVRVIWPTLVGSIFLALPCAVVVYFFMRGVIEKARAKRESGAGPDIAP